MPGRRKREKEERQEIRRDHTETETGAETEEPRHVCTLDYKQGKSGLFVTVVTDRRGIRCSNILFFFFSRRKSKYDCQQIEKDNLCFQVEKRRNDTTGIVVTIQKLTN